MTIALSPGTRESIEVVAGRLKDLADKLKQSCQPDTLERPELRTMDGDIVQMGHTLNKLRNLIKDEMLLVYGTEREIRAAAKKIAKRRI